MAFTLLRIFSLYILANYVIQLLVISISTGFNILTSIEIFDLDLQGFFINLFFLIFWSILAWFFWFKADTFSKFFEKTYTESIHLKDKDKYIYLFQIFVIILGLYFIVENVPYLVTGFIHIHMAKGHYTAHEIDEKIINLFNPGLKILFGIIITLKVKGITYFYKKLKGM